MSAKPDTHIIPSQLENAALLRASWCSASACLVSAFVETPSISWVSNSSLNTDGEIIVDKTYLGWVMKATLRVEWPWAVALYRHNENFSSNAVFVYNLAEKSYRVYKLTEEASIVMLMSYERAVVVQKSGFFIINLFAPEAETSFLPAKPLSYPLFTLCSSKSKEVLLCSMNDIQLWRFEVTENRTWLANTLFTGIFVATLHSNPQKMSFSTSAPTLPARTCTQNVTIS
jgi:hypothetical protein